MPNAGGVVPPGLSSAGGIEVQDSSRDSNYHALDILVKRRFSKGVSFTAA